MVALLRDSEFLLLALLAVETPRLSEIMSDVPFIQDP